MTSDLPPQHWLAPLAPLAVARAYVDAPPFLAGARRSVLLRASPGQAVRAPCGGVVTFRGSVAGSPPTITIACSELRSTLRWVRASAGRGRTVSRGERIGTATGSQVGLSARRGAAYLDPIRLLGAVRDHREPPPVAARRAPARSGRAPVRELAPPHLPASAYAVGHAGSRSEAAAGSRVGPRHHAGTATGSVPAAVDWPLTAAGIAAVSMSFAGVGISAVRRRRRHARAVAPRLAHPGAARR